MPTCTARKLLDLLGADSSQPSSTRPNAGNAAAWAMVAGASRKADLLRKVELLTG
jgi:hypothetical protein